MDVSPLDLFLGLALSTAVAWIAYCKHSLSLSGLYAAVILGSLIFALGGWQFWAVLILFFISSSLLSKFKRPAKMQVEADFAKTGRRDWLQVLANGAAGLGFILAGWYTDSYIFSIGYIAAIATVNADTWATEIGVLSKRPPVSVLTLKPTSPGASGAVSLLGTGAALAGAGFISAAAVLGQHTVSSVSLFPALAAATVGGLCGCFSDSLLGATVQAMYKCRVCGKLTEKTVHHHQPTDKIRGLAIFNNDMVNFISSLLGSLIAMALYYFFVS